MTAAIKVECADGMLLVDLADGRRIATPLSWFPRLRNATSAQLANYSIGPGGFGIHWEDVDEDLSVEGLLHGRRPRERRSSQL